MGVETSLQSLPFPSLPVRAAKKPILHSSRCCVWCMLGLKVGSPGRAEPVLDAGSPFVTLLMLWQRHLPSPLQNISDCRHNQQWYYLMIFKSVSRWVAKATHLFQENGTIFTVSLVFLDHKSSVCTAGFYSQRMNISNTIHRSMEKTTLMVTVSIQMV